MITWPQEREVPTWPELQELLEKFPIGGLVEIGWIGSSEEFDEDDSDYGLDLNPPEHGVVVEHLVQSAFYSGPRVINHVPVLPFRCLHRGAIAVSTTYSARALQTAGSSEDT